MRHGKRARGVVKGEGSVGDEGVDRDRSWTDERMKTKWEDVWTVRGAMSEEQEVGPKDQHQCGVREDGMRVETRSMG